MSFKYIENIALAEAAFEAKGKTLKELFESCADAFIDTSCNPKTITAIIKKDFSIEEENVESLLYDFLSELIIVKDDGFIFNKVQIKKIDEKSISAEILGEKINIKKHELKADIKAITMHKFKVEKVKDGWKAVVVMDI